jgi:phosphate transport system protein
MSTDHTLHVVDNDLAAISNQVIQLAGLTETMLQRALQAALDGRDDVVDGVVSGDAQLDELTASIERASIRMFALRQPRADDLRRPVAAMKIAMNLERCGDLAKNIAKRGRLLWRLKRDDSSLATLRQLAAKVDASLGLLKAAYTQRDQQAALAVWNGDEAIDELYEQTSAKILEGMSASPDTVESGMHMLFVAKNLERIGDHATNIAELIHYELVGAGPIGNRPKLDPLDEEL